MRTGLEVLLTRGVPALTGKRVGLVTNPTGVDSRLRSNVDLLRGREDLKLCALFGPEHGVRGEAQAGVQLDTCTDERTGLPVYSLYGEHHAPTPTMLDGLDAVLFDVQDVGVRYFTYLSTLLHVQRACAETGLDLVVLDRPNPLGGRQLEGPVLEMPWVSFVGAYPLPVRHGLTLGEVARLVAAEQGLPEPVVVPLEDWRRDDWYDETGLPWIQPSPNLPTLDSAVLYPGTCLIEGLNVSEGRGTTRPFELVGAPWVDPYHLLSRLEERSQPGVVYRATYFTPVASKHAGSCCGGVQLHITDRKGLRPVKLGLHVLAALQSLYPEQMEWVRSDNGRSFVDLLLGTDEPRRQIEAGVDLAEITPAWEVPLHEFEERRRPYLLYK